MHGTASRGPLTTVVNVDVDASRIPYSLSVRTWELRHPRLRGLAIVMLWVSVVMLVGSLIARTLGVDLPWTTPVVGLFNALVFFSVWRATKARTVISQDGIEVHDGYRTRRVPWFEVAGLQVHGRYDSVTRLRLVNDDHLVLPAVTREDLPELQRIIDTRSGTS